MEGIVDLFYQNADKFPKKTAIWCDGRENTYEELAVMVNQYSNFLLQNGVKYGAHIGFPMNNSIETVAIFLAAADIGAAVVPMNPTLPKEAVKSAFTGGGIEHLIARKSFLEKYQKWKKLKVEGKVFCVDGDMEGSVSLKAALAGDKRRPQIAKTGKEVFIITLTSGSTGAPKPIMLSQQDKFQRARTHIDWYHITKEDRILAATPLYHSLAERLVLMPLMLGATSIIMSRFTPHLWLKDVKEQKVTFTIAVSAQLGQIAELLSSPFIPNINSLKCVVSSSSLLEPHVRTNLMERLSCEFHEMYGTSEIATATDINFRKAVGKIKSVGRPLPGVEIRILDEHRGICGIGEIGEIACKTPMICSGYYGMEKSFQKNIKDGYFCTGDLGFVDEDGYLYFSGRKKELIITGGVNVYPIDVENCVRGMQEIEECAAFSYPDERLGEVVALAVVLKEKEQIGVRSIQVHCARHLADYQQPHKIFFVDSLPQNAMGKLVKSKLLELIIKE